MQGNQGLVKGLRSVLKEIGVHKAFAPNVAESSAEIIGTDELKNEILIDRNITLHRNQSIPADGIFLNLGETFVMSSAGCPVIIATAGEQMIAAHAGRDSLIDRGAVIGEPTRSNLSVVYSIIGAFIKKGFRPSEIKMWMLFSIPPAKFKHDLNHWEHGEQNRALAEFVSKWCPNGVTRKNGSIFLNLEEIFLQQAHMYGVQNALAMHSLTQFPAMAHTHDESKNPKRRNLIVIKRCV